MTILYSWQFDWTLWSCRWWKAWSQFVSIVPKKKFHQKPFDSRHTTKVIYKNSAATFKKRKNFAISLFLLLIRISRDSDIFEEYIKGRHSGSRNSARDRHLGTKYTASQVSRMNKTLCSQNLGNIASFGARYELVPRCGINEDSRVRSPKQWQKLATELCAWCQYQTFHQVNIGLEIEYCTVTLWLLTQSRVN